MNFLRIRDTTDSIAFAKDWWIFLAVAIPLTLLTVSAWGIVTHIERAEKAKGSPEQDYDEKKNV